MIDELESLLVILDGIIWKCKRVNEKWENESTTDNHFCLKKQGNT